MEGTSDVWSVEGAAVGGERCHRITAAGALRDRLARARGPTSGPGRRRGGRAMNSIQLDPALTGFGGIHGGHLAAVALETATSLAGGDRPPRSFTLCFMSPIAGGELEVVPEIEHAGRTLTVATVRLRQHGTTAATGMAIFGATRPGPARVDRHMPQVPPPEDCLPLPAPLVPGSDGLGIEHRPAAAPLPLSGS